MNENTVPKRTANDTDVLFGIPDTGVSVSWDFSAGCGTSEHDKKGTHLRPVTPKPTKYSSKVYRRRCLNQIKISADGDDAFAEQMLSLVSVNRKNIIRNSPGVSPKGRSPRNLRSMVNKPSPLRDDNFHFLLNDSIENDDMIRCSQITEAALKEEGTKSPAGPKKEGRSNSAKRLALTKSVSKPLSRKRLLDAITSSQKSPLRQTNLQRLPSPAKIASQSGMKSADQCNNNVRSCFGTRDEDDLSVNFLDDCSKAENDLPKKCPRLSLNRRIQPSITGVFPIIPKQEITPITTKEETTGLNELIVPSISVKETVKLQPAEIKDGFGEPAICDDLDDGMDFDLELSPHLLDLLDGHVGGDSQSTPNVEVHCSTKETMVSNRRTSPSTSSLRAKTDPSPLESVVPKPTSTGAKQGSSSTFMRKEVTPSLSQTAPRAEEVTHSNNLIRHASAPGRTSQAVQPIPKLNPPSVKKNGPARQCTPEEIARKKQEALKKLKRSQTK